MSTITRPYILSIAGFDPSAGAGVLADIKTFEGLHLYGLGISTATTVQTDVEFFDCRWEELTVVQKQVEVLSARFSFQVVKIGIVPSLDFLNQLLDTIHQNIPQAKIVWDPVYASSTGFQFLEKKWDENALKNVLRKITLLTPNANEAIVFGEENDSITAAKNLSAFCSVLLKGGHTTDAQATDILFHQQQEFSFVQERLDGFSKHGSGCVLSSAIAAYLAKGEDLEKACAKAKKYIHSYLQSSNSLLGYHVLAEK
jgi:hydroxymethylpyrimidine/phosphomethylpyrimidine kinase